MPHMLLYRGTRRIKAYTKFAVYSVRPFVGKPLEFSAIPSKIEPKVPN